MTTDREVRDFIVSEYLPGTPADELTSTYDLLDTGVIDSLGLLRLIEWIGDRYSIPVADMDISPENFRSIAAIGSFVAKARPESITSTSRME